MRLETAPATATLGTRTRMVTTTREVTRMAMAGVPLSSVEIAESVGQGAVLRHRQGHPRGGQQVGLQGREHGEDGGDDDEPEAERSQVGPRRGGDDRRGVGGAQLGDRAAGLDAHGGDHEEQRQVDRQGGPERQEHRPRDRAAGIPDLAADRGDQVEALQRDEGVAHRLEQADRAAREEGRQARR